MPGSHPSTAEPSPADHREHLPSSPGPSRSSHGAHGTPRPHLLLPRTWVVAQQTEGVRAPSHGCHTKLHSTHGGECCGARAGGESGDRTRWDPRLRAGHAQSPCGLCRVSSGFRVLGVSEAGVGDLGLRVPLSPPVPGPGPGRLSHLASSPVSQGSPPAARECVSPGERHEAAGAPSCLPFLAQPGSLTLWGHAAFLVCERLSAPAAQTGLSPAQ